MRSVHIYPSTFEYESRILKITKTIIENNIVSSILIIAKHRSGLQFTEKIDSRRILYRIPTLYESKNFFIRIIIFIFWSVRILLILKKENTEFINCHSLSVLPVCVLIKFIYKAKLIYEPHELETETVTFRGLKKKIAKFSENLLIKYVDHIYTVSESISSYYEKSYKKNKIPFIRNVPLLSNQNDSNSNYFYKKFNIPLEDLIFMYQGQLGHGRVLMELIDAFSNVSSNNHLVLMGFGELTNQIIALSKKSKNIHYHQAVNPDEIHKYTCSIDVGFALLSDNCLNHDSALPNKLFHYIHAGKPVIASNLSEMRKIINTYNCGWLVDNNSRNIAFTINKINKKIISKSTRNLKVVINELNWNKEEKKLIKFYSSI